MRAARQPAKSQQAGPGREGSRVNINSPWLAKGLAAIDTARAALIMFVLVDNFRRGHNIVSILWPRRLSSTSPVGLDGGGQLITGRRAARNCQLCSDWLGPMAKLSHRVAASVGPLLLTSQSGGSIAPGRPSGSRRSISGQSTYGRSPARRPSETPQTQCPLESGLVSMQIACIAPARARA